MSWEAFQLLVSTVITSASLSSFTAIFLQLSLAMAIGGLILSGCCCRNKRKVVKGRWPPPRGKPGIRGRPARGPMRKPPTKRVVQEKEDDEDDDDEDDEDEELKSKQRPNIVAPRPPTRGGIAETKDPNYQTLAGLGPDVFGVNKAANGFGGGGFGAPRAPTGGGMVGTQDPNYQTLAGIGQDIFGSKPGGGFVAGPKPPTGGGMAGTQDPNYQTLAGIGADVFGKQAGGTPKPVANPKGGLVGTNDPNYQTLAGIGADVFKKK